MPTLAERYELGDLLYSDADVVVYRGHDRLLNRAVTIELLQSQRLGDPSYVDRLVEKARKAALVNLPHVAALYDQHMVDGRPFLVLEDVAGPSLNEAAPLSADQAVELVCALATTVQTAITRQQPVPAISEHTVRIGPEGRFQVLDLGLHREAPSEHQVVTSLGNLLSTAITGIPEDGASMPLQGVVEQVLSGRTTPQALVKQLRSIQQRANQPTTVLTRVPPTVAIPDTADRHGRATAAAVPSDSLLAPAENATRPPLHRPLVWAIAATCALLLLLAAGGALLRGGEDMAESPAASAGASAGASAITGDVARSIPAGVRYVVAARGSATVRVRSGPGVNAPQVGSLPNGTVVEVISEPQPADGYRWVQIRAEGISGWCISEALRKE